MMAATMHAITENRSFSMIDTTSAESDTIAKMPANVVSRTHPANPIVLMKASLAFALVIVIIVLLFSYFTSSALRGLNLVARVPATLHYVP